MKLYKLTTSIIIFLSLFLAKSNYAQIELSGQVRDSSTFVGVPNHQVIIIADTTYQNTAYYTKTLMTDNQGNFSDTVFFVSNQSKYFIITLDCNQNPVVDSVFTIFPTPVSLDICTGGINMCIADFIAYPDSSNYQLMHFFNLSSNNSTSYLWSFGDGNYAVSQHADHQYNLGSYQVCLTVNDSASTCTNTYCDSLTISPTMNCNSDFTYSLIASKKLSFVATTNNIYPTIYSWDFGDYTTGNGKSIVHQYQQPGNYTVKVKSISFHPQTLDTCVANHHESVQVNGAPSAGIWGQVFADTDRIDNGVVYLYSYNENTNMFTLVDSSIIESIDSLDISYYLFSNLNYGKYGAYLKLSPNSIFAQNFGPSYSGNTIYWNNAQIINLNQASTNLPINLTHLYKQAGTSSISGHVYQGNKASQGDPVGGMPLFLLNNVNVIVDFQYSQADGSYSFQNLTPQKYFIYSDAINHSIYPANTIITLQNQHINNINIYISASLVTSLNEDSNPKDFRVYPNPAFQTLKFEYTNPKAQIVNVEITNLLGQKILSKSLFLNEGHDISEIDISQYVSGVYIICVTSTQNTIVREKLVISNY